MTSNIPRIINPEETFNALVNWFCNIVLTRKANGFLVGLSGTDSLVAFCAASKALEKLNMSDRMMGVHFAPSEDFLYDHPEAESHLWFKEQVIPWLKKEFPYAKIVVDTSIDWRCDGLRWGALMDMSVVSNNKTRTMLPLEEQYWVVGTRNLTEDILMNYSNASTVASLQPLLQLWKSEILQISEYLNIPKIARDKSCETDCICGRMFLASKYIREMDLLLMVRQGELDVKYVEDKISFDLNKTLTKFINSEIMNHSFKKNIPYIPELSMIKSFSPLDETVISFENGSLNIKEFNHKKHIYIAWYYLKELSFDIAVERYSFYLKELLNKFGQTNRFSLEITKSYFNLIDKAMKLYPTDNFDELLAHSPELLKNK